VEGRQVLLTSPGPGSLTQSDPLDLNVVCFRKNSYNN